MVRLRRDHLVSGTDETSSHIDVDPDTAHPSSDLSTVSVRCQQPFVDVLVIEIAWTSLGSGLGPCSSSSGLHGMHVVWRLHTLFEVEVLARKCHGPLCLNQLSSPNPSISYRHTAYNSPELKGSMPVAAPRVSRSDGLHNSAEPLRDHIPVFQTPGPK